MSRLIYLLPLLVLPLAAQIPVPPASQPSTQPVGPNPAEVVRPETPEERMQKLKAVQERLEKERAAIQELEAKGGLPGQVRQFLKERALQAATVTPAGPVPGGIGKPRGARLLGDAEKQNLGKDVVFVVDGQPVTKAEFDSTYDYLKSYPSSDTDDGLKARTVLELTRVKAAQAAFAQTRVAAHTKITAAEKKLKEGADFTAVAKELSDCPTAGQGGDIGTFGRDGFDLSLCRAAFGIKVGEFSAVTPTESGYVIIKQTGYEKGESSNLDRVRASRIFATYSPNAQAVRDLLMRVNQGQVDLAFATDDMRKFTPNEFK